jgi:U3 small nucleolar RNA-associated protein 25
MGSSIARKNKRRQEDTGGKVNAENAAENHTSNKKQRNNRGRSGYRTITRTAKRGVRELEQNEESLSDEEERLESSNEDEGPQKADTDDKGKAYNALLSLLTVEQEEESEDEDVDEEGSKLENASLGEESEDESDPSHIAGLVEDEAIEEDEIVSDLEDDSDEEDQADPYEHHFGNSSEDYLKKSIKVLESKNWKNVKETFDSHTAFVSRPPVEEFSDFTKIPTSHSLKNYKIKQKILEPFLDEFDGEQFVKKSSTAQKILDPMFCYNDILFPYNSHTETKDYRKLYTLHVLNHINRTRDKILKNNTRLRLQSERVASGELDPKDEQEYRDQGFTRPKVLILLPTRNHCYRVIQDMIKISAAEQVENLKKFKSEFYDDSEVPDSKPDDFRDLFDGNTNDFFCLGLKMNRKSLKLYSSFYNSDIIFASPIGLQLILENPDKKKRQNDFLSSIEILIIDQTHAIELQNWEHVLTILKYVNKIPEKFHDTDFSRVRMWAIEDQSKYFTQSLIFTEYNTPNINNLLTRSKNIFGKYRFRSIVSNKDSAMAKVGLNIKQIFTRFESTSPFTEPDERFNHFKSVIVPSLTKSTSYEDGLLLYIPSYTDFIRIKNYLHNKTSLLFSDVNEYSSQKELGRARAFFQQGRSKVLLYSERLHHYRRFELKGVKNIMMYGVPTNPLFYTEVVSSIGRSAFEEIADLDISTVRCLYSKWDALALERVVGSERAPILTHGQNEFYEFR